LDLHLSHFGFGAMAGAIPPSRAATRADHKRGGGGGPSKMRTTVRHVSLEQHRVATGAEAGLPWLILLGFALGGFFDGILLHQILQWHHLLSSRSGQLTLHA
jgi:uncharacterized membrane protein